MKITSLAVLCLISNTSAHRSHQRSAVRFVDIEDNDEIMTQESIQSAEKLHGKSFNPNDDTYKQSLAQNNKLSFDSEGEESFAQVFKIKNSMEAPSANVPAGVTMIQTRSDPIWGSLGVPKIAAEDLTPEQQFEQSQRGMKAPEVKDSEDVIATNNSIKRAEEITKGKMPNPSSKEEIERMKNAASTQVEYHLHTADEEDPETVETRRSVKTVEKQMKQRFFINAREKKDYDAAVASGKISPKEANFGEDDDAEIGQTKEGEAKEAKAETEKKGELAVKAKEAEDKDAEKKDAKAPAKKEGDFVPPELAGAMAF